MATTTAKAATKTVAEQIEAITIKLPKTTKSCSPTIFRQLLDLYNRRNEEPVEALDGIRLYVWRKFPAIDNGGSRRDGSYILRLDCVDQNDQVLNEPLPADLNEFLIARFGGGKFRVSLNDATIAERNAQQIAQCLVTIDDVEHPPIVDPTQLVEEDRETALWIERQLQRGRLHRDPEGKLANGPTPAPRDKDDRVIALIERMAQGNGNSAANTAMLEVFKTANQLYAEVARKNAGLDGNPNDAATSTLLKLVEMQNNMMMAWMNRAPEPERNPVPIERPKSLVDQANELLEAREIIEKLSPTGAASSRGWMQELIQSAGPILLQLGAQYMRNNAPPSAPGAPTMQPQPAQVHAPGIEMQICGMIEDRINKNFSGAQFAAFLEQQFSRPQVLEMAKPGRDNLIARIYQLPGGDRLQRRGEEVTRFFDEFIDYCQQEDDDDEPEQSPEPPAPEQSPEPPAPEPATVKVGEA